ncbi:MAG: hypothetical protein ACRDDX_06080 [Cellulosilyticaceae bacterium]
MKIQDVDLGVVFEDLIISKRMRPDGKAISQLQFGDSGSVIVSEYSLPKEIAAERFVIGIVFIKNHLR